MIAELPLTLRYALAATVCLARHADERQPARAIAAETGVPAAFLAKILRQLAKSGIIEGERGHGGGYRLARSPDELVLADIVRGVEGMQGRTEVCSMGDRPCNPDDPCALHELWTAATGPLTELAATVTVGRLARISTEVVED